MKNKNITRFKQGKQIDSKRVSLLRKRDILLSQIVKINEELHLGKKLSLFEALQKDYNVNLSKKGITTVGGRISVPLCLVGRRVKLKLTRENQNERRL